MAMLNNQRVNGITWMFIPPKDGIFVRIDPSPKTRLNNVGFTPCHVQNISQSSPVLWDSNRPQLVGC